MVTADLPPHLQRQVRELICTAEGPRDVETINYAGAFASMGILEQFTMKKFIEGFKIRIISNEPYKLMFDMIGLDVAYANALRRIMIAEVATMAIETVHLHQNTGVIQDEVLCHRLGLIPFRVDPEDFAFRTENEELNAENALRFKLHVVCDEDNIVPSQRALPIYSGNFVWEPLSEKQRKKYEGNPPGPINDNILITKLRPGQEIEAYCYVEKGIGKTHAKWTPSAPAVYRLQPKIVFPEGPLKDAEAIELKELCPMKVFDIEDLGGGVVQSIVADPRKCTTCRACVERFPGRVEVRKIKDHFIFQVESTGAIPAVEIFRRSIKVFIQKLGKLRQSIDKFRTPGVVEDDDEDIAEN